MIMKTVRHKSEMKKGVSYYLQFILCVYNLDVFLMFKDAFLKQ